MKNYNLPILVNQVFDENLSGQIISTLLYYEKYFSPGGYYGEAMAKDGYQANIKLYINSPGGICTDLFAILDTLGMMTIPFQTYCLGQAASCGAVLFASGPKGSRFIGKNSRVLLHQVSAGMWGDVTDIEIAAKEAKRMNDQIISIVAKACGKSKEEVRDDIDRDLWLTAKEAIAYGIADGIIEPDAPEMKELASIKIKGASVFTVGEDIETKRATVEKEKKSIVFEIKEVTEDDKYFNFSGYASVFGNADGDNDVMHPGSFQRTLKELVLLDNAGDRTVLWQHNTDEPVGRASLKEDKNGLYFTASLPKDDDFVKGRVIPQIRSGSIRNMSFGYRVMDKYFKDGLRHITDVELYEISLVTIPANPQAKITNVKSGEKVKFETITDISRYLKKSGLSKSETDSVVIGMKELLEKGAPCNEDEPDAESQKACKELFVNLESLHGSLKESNK